MTGTDENTLPFLMASLKEVQDTVRAYDTKAQIVGVGYIFAIGIIINIGTRIADLAKMGAATITLAWLVFCFSHRSVRSGYLSVPKSIPRTW